MMANWASTEYMMEGNLAEKMFDCLCRLRLDGNNSPSFTDIIKFFDSSANISNLYLRGMVDCYEYFPKEDDDTTYSGIRLSCDTACGECADFRNWIDQNVAGPEDSRILYSVEEPGQEIYATNNPNHEKYYIEDRRSGDYWYTDSDIEVKELIKEVTGSKKESIGELMEDLNSYNSNCPDDDLLVFIHEFQYDI